MCSCLFLIHFFIFTQFAENSAVAYSVATVVASDVDYGNDGDITYSIACENMFLFVQLAIHIIQR